MSRTRRILSAGFLVCAASVLVLLLNACQAAGRSAAVPTLAPVLLPAEETIVRAGGGNQGPDGRGSESPEPAAASARARAVISPTATPSPTASPSRAAEAITARIMALGVHPSIALRESPGRASRVVATVPGARVLWVQGQSPDGAWLLAAYDDVGNLAWVARGDVRLVGGVGTPEVVSGERTPAPVATAIQPDGARAQATPTTGGHSSQTPARPPGKIVFQASTGGGIYLVNADGSGFRRVTDGLDPALSPDGTRLAFARWGTPHGVYVLDLRTGQELRVASANRPRSPSWSPDGTRLAFSYTVRTWSCRISPFGCLEEDALRARFGGQECITTPFGRLCIKDLPVQLMEQYGLVQVDSEGDGWQDLPAQRIVQSPQWHPVHDQIVYRGDPGLQITEPAGGTRPLSDDPAWGSPAWSPDGQQIVAQKRLHDHMDIFVMDAAGNVLRRLTAPEPLGRAPNNVAPAWSPDGRYIVYLTDREGPWRLYWMNADGSQQRPFLPAVLRDLEFTYDFAAERVVDWGR